MSKGPSLGSSARTSNGTRTFASGADSTTPAWPTTRATSICGAASDCLIDCLSRSVAPRPAEFGLEEECQRFWELSSTACDVFFLFDSLPQEYQSQVASAPDDSLEL